MTVECRTEPTDGAKYTRLTALQVMQIVDMAMKPGHFFDFILSADILDTVQVKEYAERPGTFFVNWHAKSWRDATAFQVAVVGAAWACGRFADVIVEWCDADTDSDDDGRRLVNVFVAAADYMDETGHVVA